MTISAELEAQILRYHHVEKWKVGTIARQLKLHHSGVERVLIQSGIPKRNLSGRQSILTPFLPFIFETLKKYPKLPAVRLYHMIRERGYPGSADHLRHFIMLNRPKPPAEAYLRLRTLPGEQAQIDWAHFDHIIVGKAKRPLMAFVMVLSFSRKIFLRFYLNAQMANFLRGHEAAFQEWGGLPRVCLYDNLRSAVLERQGDAIRFNPTLLSFAAHYRFEPRPVAVARGNEKGRVERAIRYIRDNFFSAIQFTDLDDLNTQAMNWCNGPAADRPCPEDNAHSVRTMFEQEKPKLLKLPDNPFQTDEREDVRVGKTPYVRFDLNDYSIPHTHVRRTLTIVGETSKILVLDGAEIIAHHPRSYDKGQQIEQESHIQALVKSKKEARHHRGQDRLAHACPSSLLLMMQAAERGYSLKNMTSTLLLLLESYGATELEIAIKEALLRQVPHSNTIRLCLERRREQRHQLPTINLDLPRDERVRNLIVQPHNLENYDQLQEEEDNGL